MGQAAIGFRAHTGWAAAVTLGSTPASPEVIDRRRVNLLEPDVPWEAYHAAGRMAPDEAEELIVRAAASAARMATQALRELITEVRTAGQEIVASGVVLSGARPLLTVAEALSSHVSKHSAEGQLYRQALLDASRACGLRVIALAERELFDAAAAQLVQSVYEVRRRINELGRELGPPWAQDQKNAALIAWLALAGASRPAVHKGRARRR